MFDVPECVKMRNSKMRSNTSPRGSPRIRLISSLAMLILAVGGVSFYSVRKTGDLFGIGVNDHVRCAVANADTRQEGLGVQFSPMLQTVLDAAGADYAVRSAHRCSVEGRAYFHVILQRNQIPVSLIFTRRTEQEVFPRALAGRVVHVAGITLHEGTRDGYSVAAFESGSYLGYIVSALPGEQNSELAALVAPVMDRYTKPLEKNGQIGVPGVRSGRIPPFSGCRARMRLAARRSARATFKRLSSAAAAMRDVWWGWAACGAHLSLPARVPCGQQPRNIHRAGIKDTVSTREKRDPASVVSGKPNGRRGLFPSSTAGNIASNPRQAGSEIEMSGTQIHPARVC